ncbi:MAG: amidase [Betaproteobacteria bacterium]|nr:amidase [Betaproteobacteria bacterium]
MNLNEYASQDATGLATLIRSGEVSVAEVQKVARQALEAVNPKINALAAPLFDKPLDYNASGPFAGVPFAIKDIVCHAANVPTRFGSRMIPANFAFPHDTELMKRWRAAGLATLGISTTPEFGYNSNTEALVYGSTKNPWNTARSPGGSSGGAAALVASRALPVAHANDGGGSIRIPAGICGVVGLKPTRGRVSLAPDAAEALSGMAIEFAVSRSVRDTAALLDAVEGPAAGEKYEIARPARPYLKEVGADPGRLKIAISPKGWSPVPIHPACVAAVEKTAKVLAGLGHHIEEATPKFDVEAFDNANVNLWSVGLADWIMAFAETLKLTPSPDNLEATIWACLQHGKKLSAIDLLTSEHVMNTVCRTVGAFFQDYDLLLTPTVAAPATSLGFLNANDPTLDATGWTRKIFTNMPFTALFNVTGQPAISLPLCMSDDGLPVGLQFVGHFGDEGRLIQIASQLEQAMPWINRKPAVCAGA